MMGSSKNVIPAKAGIQKPLTSLDSGVRRSDELIILRGGLKLYAMRYAPCAMRFSFGRFSD